MKMKIVKIIILFVKLVLNVFIPFLIMILTEMLIHLLIFMLKTQDLNKFKILI
jgi:hypothetical protein